MSKRWIYLGAGIAAYTALVFFGKRTDLLYLVPVGLVFSAAGVLNYLGIRLYSAISGRSFGERLRFNLALAAFGVVLALPFPLRVAIDRQRVSAAKAYPALVAPVLEKYRQQHGAYPDSLDELRSRPSVPGLLRGSKGYRRYGAGDYSFAFPDPTRSYGGWTYRSDNRTWSYSEFD